MEKGKIIFLLILLIFLKFVFTFSKSSPIDMPLFLAWSSHLAKNGFSDFYQVWKDSDPYPPFSLYFLWVSGKIASFFDYSQKIHEFLIKFWLILAEILGGYLIYQIARKQKKEKTGFLLALIYCFNPAVFFNSSIWGQFDSLLGTFLLFSVYLFELKKQLFGLFIFILSFFIKPQTIFLAPVILFLLLRDFSFKKVIISLFFLLSTSFLLFFPFVPKETLSFIISYHFQRFQQYPYATANAFNFWMMVGGQTVFDENYFLGFSYRTWGLILTFFFQFLSIFLLFKFKKDPFYLYSSSFLSLFSSFFFLTRMHERYLIPSLIFLTVLLIWEKSLWRLLFFLSLSVFVNNYYIFWRSWYGSLNDQPYFVWVEKNNLIAISFSFITFLCFLYFLFFLLQKNFSPLKNFKIKIFSFSNNFSVNNQEKKGKIFLIFLLISLSFFTRFFMLEHPPEVVFDEVHYGKAVNGYLKREYFFTGHPPLGPQLITLGGLIGNYKANFEFKEIGEKFKDNSYVFLRRVPAFFGALIPLILFFFLKEIGFSDVLAFFGALFLIFENSLLVQSRFILIDVFWIFFGFLGLTLFFVSRRKNYHIFYLTTSWIFFGLAAATKWTALSFPLFAGIFFAFDFFKEFFKKTKKEIFLIFLKGFFGILVSFFFAYFIPFLLHFEILKKPGPGDAFMSKEFLTGQKNVFEKFIELNTVSYETNIKGMKASHPYSSKFYTWPFLLRPIFYWNNEDQKIYFLGNPILWWLSTLSVFSLLFFTIFSQELLKREQSIFILLGYFLNTLPYLNVERATFLYHYLPALIFSVFSLLYLVSLFKNSKFILIFLFFLFFISFLYFSPLTYGFSLSKEEFEMRVWLKSWI